MSAAAIPHVTFYDLPPEGRWPLCARLAGAAWQRRRPLTLHCADVATARALDEYLWVFAEDAFLPHEVAEAGAPLADAEARIVLVCCEHAPIAREILVQEAPASLDFAATFIHVVDLVDHRSPESLAQSRARFRAWRDHGVTPEVRKEAP